MTVSQQEHLLLTLPFAEPTPLLNSLKEKHPTLKITYRNSGNVAWSYDQFDDDLYKDVTIIATLAALPSKPAAAPHLKFVHIFVAGTNHLEKSPVYHDPAITFTNSSGIHAPTIAEWVLMTMLVSNRKYNVLHDWQKERYWGPAHDRGQGFMELSDNVGKRIGILGYGSIGRQVARVAKAFGMDVIAYTASPRKTPESRKDDGFWMPGVGDPEGEFPSAWFSGGEKKDLHQFLGQDLDYLLVSVPLTKKTRYMLGKEEFEVLGKKHTFVANIARGDVLVQDELINALKAFESSGGKEGIRGAAVDVASPEPLPSDNPLWDAPNIIITPHVSGLCEAYAGRCFQVLEQNVDRNEKGKKLLNIVDREKGYSSNATTKDL